MVSHAAEDLLGGAGGVVQHHPVEVAHADHHLHGVAERAFPDDADGREEAKGAPDELCPALADIALSPHGCGPGSRDLPP